MKGFCFGITIPKKHAIRKPINLLLTLKFKLMCNLKKFDNVRKAYEAYQYQSDCFAFRTDARLAKMIYLIDGKDPISEKIISELRGYHSFYSTYKLDANMSEEPTAEQVQNAINQIRDIGLQGSGMLIAHPNLIEEYPSYIRMLGLVRTDYDEDYIKLMSDFAIKRHYASRIKVMKEKKYCNLKKECYKSQIFYN